MPLAQRLALLKPTAVNAILGEVQQFRNDGGQPVSLMRGAPDLPTPTHIVEAAEQALRAGRTGYPDNRGESSLREAVSRAIVRRGGPAYSADDEILITTGATLGLYAALGAILDPGDEVLLPEPVYDAYVSAVVQLGAAPCPVPATRIDGRFSWDPNRVADACHSRTRALLVNSPWNPTGTVLTPAEWESLIEIADRHDLFLISDEIYETICYDGHTHVTPAALSDAARRRTILVNSLSKTYSMTGWRVGFCAAPADVISAMFLVLQQSSRGPATFVQDAAVAALDGPQDCVERMTTEYARRRELVLSRLADIPGVELLRPEGGFFAMADVGSLGSSSNQIRRALLNDHAVVVMHGGAYGPSAEGTLRISFASGGDNLDVGLERLEHGLRAIGS
ncbi:MAG: aminotransferase class I/II [Planctomycetaceae bacterium]|jgi:aspartate/methionine/tyrosine aminotransferase|nr:aminotransferase class I/II [Planctomycetaceae bacterium]